MFNMLHKNLSTFSVYFTLHFMLQIVKITIHLILKENPRVISLYLSFLFLILLSSRFQLYGSHCGSVCFHGLSVFFSASAIPVRNLPFSRKATAFPTHRHDFSLVFVNS